MDQGPRRILARAAARTAVCVQPTPARSTAIPSDRDQTARSLRRALTRLRTAALPSAASPTEGQPSQGSRHFRRRVRSGGSGACAAPVLSRLEPPLPTAPPPALHPPAHRGPVLACYSRKGAFSTLHSRDSHRRGSSHGDGSSERTVRAAGESGDDHDGPQLHPALSAGSPQGSWGLTPRACPETLSPAVPAPPITLVVSCPRGPWTFLPSPEGPPLAAFRASSHSQPTLLAAPALFPGRPSP